MKTEAGHTIILDLGAPVEVRGHMAQRLGTVSRIGISLASRRLVMVELQTASQTLTLNGDLIRYDEDLGCWYLQRRDGMHRTPTLAACS